MANWSRAGTHNRVQAISRGLVPELKRLTEDHGVCLSSCLDYWEDDLILQAFNRCLILAPELYGNPWFLRDDEFPKLARIFNLHRRYRDIMVNGMVLDEQHYGPLAVARGSDTTRLITLRHLDWRPAVRHVKGDESIGCGDASEFEVRLLHPTERVLGTFNRGQEVPVEVLPFRSCLLLGDANQTGGVGVRGCDYEVVREVPGKEVVLRLLRKAGKSGLTELVTGGRKFRRATMDGQPAPDLVAGRPVTVTFAGTLAPDDTPWHRQIAGPQAFPSPNEPGVPPDAEALFESSCFAGDNDPLEIRSLRRSGPSRIPVVQKARQAFLDQPIIAQEGMLTEYLLDGKPGTFCNLLRGRAREPQGRLLRIDVGETRQLDSIVLELPAGEVRLRPSHPPTPPRSPPI